MKDSIALAKAQVAVLENSNIADEEKLSILKVLFDAEQLAVMRETWVSNNEKV